MLAINNITQPLKQLIASVAQFALVSNYQLLIITCANAVDKGFVFWANSEKNKPVIDSGSIGTAIPKTQREAISKLLCEAEQELQCIYQTKEFKELLLAFGVTEAFQAGKLKFTFSLAPNNISFSLFENRDVSGSHLKDRIELIFTSKHKQGFDAYHVELLKGTSLTSFIKDDLTAIAGVLCEHHLFLNVDENMLNKAVTNMLAGMVEIDNIVLAVKN